MVSKKKITRSESVIEQAGQIIIIFNNDMESKKIATNYASGGKVPSQSLKKWKQSKKAIKDLNRSKDATKESNCTKDSSSQHISELSKFDDTTRESFSSGYTGSTPFDQHRVERLDFDQQGSPLAL